jgi:hypothetical protein
VRSEEAYALGKMLDNSSWQHPRAGDVRLARNITPSDIDLCLDNNGMILACELSRSASKWQQLLPGQRILYQSLVYRSAHIAVLCHHSVAPEEGRKIDTRYDIDSFQIMMADDWKITIIPVINGNFYWRKFVEMWFTDPYKLRCKFFGVASMDDEISKNTYLEWIDFKCPI